LDSIDESNATELITMTRELSSPAALYAYLFEYILQLTTNFVLHKINCSKRISINNADGNILIF